MVFIAGDTLRQQPMGAGHMTVLQLCEPIADDTLCHQPMGAGHMTAPVMWVYGTPCPAMVSPNASRAIGGQAVVPG